MVIIKEIRSVLPDRTDDYFYGHIYSSFRYKQLRQQQIESFIAEQKLYCAGVQAHASNVACSVPNMKAENVIDNEKSSIPTHKSHHLYVCKLYSLQSWLPIWNQKFVGGDDKLVIESKCWYEFPYSYTVYTVPLLKENVRFTVRTKIVENDRGNIDNALQLTAEQIKIREVIRFDITNDASLDLAGFSSSLDPKFFKSKKHNKGPLLPGWQLNLKDDEYMCDYSVITVNVVVWPTVLKSKVEEFIMQHLLDIDMKLKRFTFCFIDDWLNVITSYSQLMNLGSQETLRSASASPSSLSPSSLSASSFANAVPAIPPFSDDWIGVVTAAASKTLAFKPAFRDRSRQAQKSKL